MALKDIIPSHLAYCISKLREGYWNGYPLAEMDLATIVGYQATIKADLDKKYGSYKRLDSISYELDDIDYILLRLQQMFGLGSIKDNRDAKVFIWALDNHFERVKNMFVEMDTTGWHPDDPA